MTVYVRDFDIDELIGLNIRIRDRKKLVSRTVRQHVSLRTTRQRKNCKRKMRFKEYADAERALESYMSRIMFSNMGFYWCHRHSAHHLGHDKRLPKDLIVSRERETVQRRDDLRTGELAYLILGGRDGNY